MNKVNNFLKSIPLKWIGPFLVTFFSTVLGVYYGFILSENKAIEEKKSQKNIAIENIVSEFESNRDKLELALESLENWMQVQEVLIPKKKDSDNYLISKKDYLSIADYDIFQINDTIQKAELIIFRGELNVTFETPEFSFIAYEASKSINILNEFSFECLYGIESVYNRQINVEKEFDKLIEALQDRNLDKLNLVVEISTQLGNQLMKGYIEVLKTLKHCS